MKPADVGIAVLVAVTWGFGFIASRLALNEFSPELMTTLRFAIAALPCLFLRKPAVSWPVLIAISFTLFLGQFLAQAFAIAIATAGLLMICGTVGYDFSVSAFAIIMISPICFAIGNLLLRKANGAPMYDLFAWLCFTSAVPLVVLTLMTNGPAPIWHELSHASATAIACMFFLGGIAIMLLSKRPQALPKVAGA